MLKLVAFLSVFILSSFTCSKDGAAPADTTDNTSAENYGVNKNTLLQLVNEIRRKGCNCGGTKMPAVEPVSWNNQLAQAAFNHSKDMNAKNYFSHSSPSGSDPGARIRAAGYAWKAYGENIAHNYPDEQAVVAGWLSSPTHCKTLMNPYYREMGVGRAGPYWTQDFGAK